MKKKSDKFDNVLLGLVIGAALVLIAMFIMISAMPTKRSPKAIKYDLNCVAGRSRNPLVECRE